MDDYEVDFICPCPVDGCPNNKRDTYRWTHSKCGGYEKLDSNGCLRCLRCDESGPLIDWSFSCGAHGYEKASLQGFIYCLSIIGKLQKPPMKFLLKLTRSVNQMYEDADDYK